MDLSYNSFREGSGEPFRELLSAHATLLDVSLKWNSLRAKGGAAVAEGLKTNNVLNKARGARSRRA